MDEDTPQPEDVALETPLSNTFVPPSIIADALLRGESYTHFSPVPPSLSSQSQSQPSTDPCILGVDEAGRGPVLGPMVYGVFYLPSSLSESLLRETHHFDDSKVLTPAFRSSLMRTLCDSSSDLSRSCGWAISALSARDISAGMLRPATSSVYNLNAQAFDATVSLIRGVLDRGVDVREVYVDTVGPPASYQAKLSREFPGISITVAKKADSLYPCVSAASVCAKVTRDAALETLYEARRGTGEVNGESTVSAEEDGMAWGSGYPSDGRCVAWLRGNMHPVFGWGSECRFSWGTAKDMIEGKGGVKVDWPVDDGENGKLTDFFVSEDKIDSDELGGWFGTPVGQEAF